MDSLAILFFSLLIELISIFIFIASGGKKERIRVSILIIIMLVVQYLTLF